ncbi:hypothetical protein AWB74_07274 [Caballeronia arvi]|uniref:Uncharacterized protein n=1 Tax=Caballeronia arvi TaxID=1777135 RepID=A0A158KXA9_9BURK|nr:hypothetical protein AWB74_07274 [Caballeronia arvi]
MTILIGTYGYSVDALRCLRVQRLEAPLSLTAKLLFAVEHRTYQFDELRRSRPSASCCRGSNNAPSGSASTSTPSRRQSSRQPTVHGNREEHLLRNALRSARRLRSLLSVFAGAPFDAHVSIQINCCLQSASPKPSFNAHLSAATAPAVVLAPERQLACASLLRDAVRQRSRRQRRPRRDAQHSDQRHRLLERLSNNLQHSRWRRMQARRFLARPELSFSSLLHSFSLKAANSAAVSVYVPSQRRESRGRPTMDASAGFAARFVCLLGFSHLLSARSASWLICPPFSLAIRRSSRRLSGITMQPHRLAARQPFRRLPDGFGRLDQTADD